MAKNRILIVEDDKYIAENVGINLDMSGYDYTIISDGLAVVDHLEKDHSYDLALLDVMLPGLGLCAHGVYAEVQYPRPLSHGKDRCALADKRLARRCRGLHR